MHLTLLRRANRKGCPHAWKGTSRRSPCSSVEACVFHAGGRRFVLKIVGGGRGGGGREGERSGDQKITGKEVQIPQAGIHRDHSQEIQRSHSRAARGLAGATVLGPNIRSLLLLQLARLEAQQQHTHRRLGRAASSSSTGIPSRRRRCPCVVSHMRRSILHAPLHSPCSVGRPRAANSPPPPN